MRQCPALFIAAPASNQGKTTITTALAQFHRERGRRVRIFKTGPDFLDPMILERASGHSVYQLDLWMGDEAHCRQLLYDAAGEADLILIEGVMGLFDGEPSSAELARLFNIPILAVIDGSAMAQTFGAIAYGLANYRPDLPFAGVFANRVASEGHYQMLAESLAPGMNMVGWMASDADIALPERHLGLVQADEVADLDQRILRAVIALNDVDDNLPAAVNFSAPASADYTIQLAGQRIAIAQDEAFAFLYPANLELLSNMGAELSFFSPLADEPLPENAGALYLPGGYPELHLQRLATNQTTANSIREHHATDRPIVAECGGMLYLMESLSDTQGECENMLGLLPGHAFMQDKLAKIGMYSVELPEGQLRGHSFHYSRLETSLTPIVCSEGARSSRQGEPMYREGRLQASYMHFYFPSNPETTAKLFAA